MEKHKDGKGDVNFDDRTKLLLELRATAENQFDKQIVYLAGGGLVFSIGFVKDILGVNKAPDCKILLFGVWICFAVSLIVNLFSYLTSSKTSNYQLNSNKKKSDTFDSLTKILNTTSIITLLLGIILLIWFSIINF